MEPVEGKINAVKYQDIIEINLWLLHARHFSLDRYFFQDESSEINTIIA